MVRNFIKLKGLPFLPTLICLNKIGPGELILIKIEIIMRKGKNSKSPIRDNRISKDLGILKYKKKEDYFIFY
jgi:hypothetical protein